HTEDDYRAAMARVDALWGSSGTTKNDELEVLAVLIDNYEECQDLASPAAYDPIEDITCLMEQRGL
ncbi:MAG: transcriptional regulator, partial [Azoarcus sp.]|nr:transcriptional regulator [Azoarcus sp.]